MLLSHKLYVLENSAGPCMQGHTAVGQFLLAPCSCPSLSLLLALAAHPGHLQLPLPLRPCNLQLAHFGGKNGGLMGYWGTSDQISILN